MSVLRTIHCDACGTQQTEPQAGAGWQGWGSINGVALNNIANPNLCPQCMFKTMQFVDSMAKANGMEGE